MNGAVFIYARALFIPFAALLSKRCPCGWMRFGCVEWPWACLALALGVPLLMESLDPSGSLPYGSAFDFVRYVRHNSGFVRELCPYYFLYPLLVGGIRFPRWIVTSKARLPWPLRCALQVAGVYFMYCIIEHLGITNTLTVDAINTEHHVWREKLLSIYKGDDKWSMFNALVSYADLYAAMWASLVFLCAACIAPLAPTVFSMMGTRVIGSYMTLPLTLNAAGHFLGLAILDIGGPWRVHLVEVEVLLLILFILATTCQSLPDWTIQWVADGTLPSFLTWQWPLAGSSKLGRKSIK